MTRVWNPEIVTILVATSILPASVLALACCVEWRRQKSRIRSVYAAQALASLFHLIDQIVFLLILVVPASSIENSRGCVALAIVPPILFGMMQPIVVMVLLFRVTALLPSSVALVAGTREWILSKVPVRIGIGMVFCVGWCLIVSSQVRGTWGVNSHTDRCVYVPDRSLNSSGKVAFLVTYSLIGVTYITALVRHGVWRRFLIKRPSAPDSKQGQVQTPSKGNGASKLSSTQVAAPDQSKAREDANTHLTAATMGEGQHDATSRLNQALLSVMYRILLAVCTYLITSSLALANFFAGGAYVQFSIENTCAILASTFATLSREQDWRSKVRMESEATSVSVAPGTADPKAAGHVGKKNRGGHAV